MNKEEFKKINETGWDELIKSKKEFSNTSLPEYGPYMANEEKLELFKDVMGKKVLELGCAAGKSLKYLADKGAAELWGLDISKEQINLAENLNIPNSHFITFPMEEENSHIPKNYFDYVLSLYSIGFSSSPVKTLELASSYLAPGGKFIMCWIHPFYNCLAIEDDKLVVSRDYNDEGAKQITKGPDKIPMMQYNLKISTLLNSLIASGLQIEKIIEEEPTVENGIGSYQSTYWDPRKLKASPTTLIIVASKK